MEYLNYINAQLIKEVLFELIIVILVGISTNVIYKKTYKGVALSKNFANTLTGLTIISYFVIKCVANNSLVSLGMVGALSIVRFRNAVKDSMDIMYAFWAIAQGILIGAQEYFLAIVLNLTMVIFVFVILKSNNNKRRKMVLIAKYNKKIDLKKFENLLQHNFESFILKEQKIANAGELIIEVVCNNNIIQSDLDKLRIEGIEEISLIDYVEPMI